MTAKEKRHFMLPHEVPELVQPEQIVPSVTAKSTLVTGRPAGSPAKSHNRLSCISQPTNPTHTDISQMRGIPHLPGDVVVLPHLPVCHTGMGSIYIHRLEECAKAHTPRFSHEKKEARTSSSRSSSAYGGRIEAHLFLMLAKKEGDK
jgi:hypothetical protein